MSVLIKGMEMPKDGTYNIVYIYSDGRVSMPFWGKGMRIVSGITAVPVPPHGRLIDADKLEKAVCCGCKKDCIECAIANAPTVIPSDKDGET